MKLKNILCIISLCIIGSTVDVNAKKMKEAAGYEPGVTPPAGGVKTPQKEVTTQQKPVPVTNNFQRLLQRIRTSNQANIINKDGVILDGLVDDIKNANLSLGQTRSLLEAAVTLKLPLSGDNDADKETILYAGERIDGIMSDIAETKQIVPYAGEVIVPRQSQQTTEDIKRLAQKLITTMISYKKSTLQQAFLVPVKQNRNYIEAVLKDVLKQLSQSFPSVTQEQAIGMLTVAIGLNPMISLPIILAIVKGYGQQPEVRAGAIVIVKGKPTTPSVPSALAIEYTSSGLFKELNPNNDPTMEKIIRDSLERTRQEQLQIVPFKPEQPKDIIPVPKPMKNTAEGDAQLAVVNRTDGIMKELEEGKSEGDNKNIVDAVNDLIKAQPDLVKKGNYEVVAMLIYNALKNLKIEVTDQDKNFLINIIGEKYLALRHD